MSIRRALLFSASIAIAPLLIPPSTLAQQPESQAPSGTLVKFVILSRHGVRSPIPKQDVLNSWTAFTWPTWYCGGSVCKPGQLTEQGAILAVSMGTHYRAYLSGLLPAMECPDAADVFFWADRDERTQATARALLFGFRSYCNTDKYFHIASTSSDRIFHPVTGVLGASCKLDDVRAKRDILLRVGGDLEKWITNNLTAERQIAQNTLQCCTQALCDKKACGAASICTLPGLPSCLVAHQDKALPTKVEFDGGLRIAETFAEILLLEYANGFELKDVGWGRITREDLSRVFRIHTVPFDLEQRTPYVASLQGSRLLSKILLALQGKNDGKEGTAPKNAKFVAYVGHDTNIANVAGMLGLSWHQPPDYQENQTPPAGALIFELWQTDAGATNVHVYYAAQALDDMRKVTGKPPVRSPVRVPNCNADAQEYACPLDKFEKLVTAALDPQPGCWK